jgi:hypothetical protein
VTAEWGPSRSKTTIEWWTWNYPPPYEAEANGFTSPFSSKVIDDAAAATFSVPEIAAPAACLTFLVGNGRIALSLSITVISTSFKADCPTGAVVLILTRPVSVPVSPSSSMSSTLARFTELGAKLGGTTVGEALPAALKASRKSSCAVRKVDGVLNGVFGGLVGTALVGEVRGVVRGVLRVVA